MNDHSVKTLIDEAHTAARQMLAVFEALHDAFEADGLLYTADGRLSELGDAFVEAGEALQQLESQLLLAAEISEETR